MILFGTGNFIDDWPIKLDRLKEAFRAIAAKWDFALATFAMQRSQFVVSCVVPNIDHRGIEHVAEDLFAAVVQAAQGYIAVDQDGHCAPEPIAWFSDTLLFSVAKSTAPVVDMSKVDVIDHAREHLLGLSAVGGLASCRDDDRRFHFGLVAKGAKRFDVFDDFGVIQTDAQGVKLFGVRTIDADFDFVQTAVQNSLGNFAAKQVAVGEDLHAWDTLVLAVFDSVSKLLIDQRFTVSMEMHKSSPTFDALLDDRLKDLLFHVGFRPTDRRSRAKDAVGLAVICRFDTHGFRKRLTQKRHGICDDIRGDRTDGAHERLS